MFYSDDPVRDADRYDMEMHRQRERCRRGSCACCGEAIYGYEDYYDIDGILLHEDCLTDWAYQYKK